MEKSTLEELTAELKSKLPGLTQKLVAVTSLSMVRMHNIGDIDLYQIKTWDHLMSIVDQIGISR
jgi:hypothetical protein